MYLITGKEAMHFFEFLQLLKVLKTRTVSFLVMKLHHIKLKTYENILYLRYTY